MATGKIDFILMPGTQRTAILTIVKAFCRGTTPEALRTAAVLATVHGESNRTNFSHLTVTIFENRQLPGGIVGLEPSRTDIHRYPELHRLESPNGKA